MSIADVSHAHSSPPGSASVEALLIERGIPIPPTRGGQPKRKPCRPSIVADAFERMSVGESFWQMTPAGLTPKRHNSQISAYANAWAFRNAPHWRFTTRRENNGIRIWRVA